MEMIKARDVGHVCSIKSQAHQEPIKGLLDQGLISPKSSNRNQKKTSPSNFSWRTWDKSRRCRWPRGPAPCPGRSAAPARPAHRRLWRPCHPGMHQPRGVEVNGAHPEKNWRKMQNITNIYLSIYMYVYIYIYIYTFSGEKEELNT